MTSEKRIIITRLLPGDPVDRFARSGFTNVWIYPENQPMPRDELLRAIAGAHAVVATPADTVIDVEFYDAAGDQLVVASNFGVGVDNIDLEAAARRGVIISHTPHAVTEPTADVAWLLMLAAGKRAHEGNALVRSGAWAGVGPDQLLGRRMHGSTLLIIGAGRIGYATARRAFGWNVSVLYHSRDCNPAFERPPVNGRFVSLEEGLTEADYVSLHVPLTAETHHMINAERLAMMKPTAVLVNTARGAIVDEAALVEALRTGGIAAAGLDVFENEPQLTPGLAELDNVFLLPHIATATVEDRQWMMRLAVDNAIAALRGERVPHPFILPDVD